MTGGGPAVRAFAVELERALHDAREHLDRLDSAGGDADHGTTMLLAAKAVRNRLDEDPTDDDVPALLRRCADGFASVGGSVGPLWALMFSTAAASWPEGGVHDLAQLRDLSAAVVDDLRQLGGANEGDGTMVDALAPAARAALAAATATATTANAADTTAVPDALGAMLAAARDGAAGTTGTVARVGRASRSGLARPSEDPGAASAVIVLGTLVRVLNH